jgi:hypothetical protein
MENEKKKKRMLIILMKAFSKNYITLGPLRLHWEMDSDLNSNILSNHTFQGFLQRKDPNGPKAALSGSLFAAEEKEHDLCFLFRDASH